MKFTVLTDDQVRELRIRRAQGEGDAPILTRIRDRIVIAETDSAAWLTAKRGMAAQKGEQAA